MTRSLFALLVCLFSLLVTNATASDPDLNELEIDHALTFDFKTPHTKWAKPYAGGKIRVLFFADGTYTSTNPRECVELMQRFDIDAQAIFWALITDHNKSHWHGGKLGEQRMLNLLRQKWDCFVFLGQPAIAIPAEQQELIRKAVLQGTGIVFVGSDNKTLLLDKKRIDPLPSFIGDENVVDAFTAGKGRVTRLLSRPNIDYHEGWEIDYDYWQESLGRAVLWSAGKEPAAKLDLNLTASGQATGRKAQVSAGKPAHLIAKVSGKVTSKELRILVSLRKPGHEELILPEKSIVPGEDITVLMPALSKGTWHADARIIGSAGLETWTTIPFEVRSDRTVSGLILKPDWSEPGGVISGKVLVSGSRLPKETMRIQLLDRRRRELARKDVPVTGSSMDFTFDMPEWLPMLVTVEARLLADTVEVSRAYKYFHVTKRKQGQFNFLIWGAPKGTLAPYAEESLAQQGVTLQLEWGTPPLHAGAFDITWVPYTEHIKVEKTPSGIMKPNCWNDLLAVRKKTSLLASNHRASREHGVFVYSIGDENSSLGSCLSPFCATAYRDFLKESYGTLGALNRSWGTDFNDWKDAGLALASDDDEQTSKAARNYPRWFDRQAYKSWNYVQLCLKYSKSYKALDPQAKTGFDGSAGFATGDDLDLIIRNLGSWVPYHSLTEEVIRSIAPRNFVRSNWLGGRFKTADPLLQRYWRLVTLGADSIWWWMYFCIGDLHGFLAPDFRPFPEIAEVVKDTQIVRDGLGDLLLHSTMQGDAIAVLYSYPSVFAHKLDEGASFGGYEEAHTALISTIRAAGLQFNYVTDRMLRQGEEDLSKYKILFLPRTEAIGDTEAKVIRRFVEQGGTVVADLRPGLYDDHCKRRTAGILDDLFGIKRGAGSPAGTVNLGKGSTSLKTLVDNGIVPAGAQAGRKVDGVPVWLSRTVGKGRAILLNSQMNTLPGVELTGIRKGSFLGAEPVYMVSGADGRKKDNVEITRWLDGGLEIVSLLRKDGAKEDLSIAFSGTKYVYDMRSRKIHGPCNRFAATLLPNRASFFVLSDKPLPGLHTSLSSTTVQPGTSVKAYISVPGAEGLHAVKMNVYTGDRHLDWYDKLLLVGEHPVTTEFPVAYNDPEGEYRIVFSDLFTNEKYSSGLKVQSISADVSRQVN